MDTIFTIAAYGQMISDAARMDGYTRALRQAVRPGAVVVDIGTGTGIFALLACRLGARRVYAIEPGDVIQVAREIAVSSGCGDRIEFIQALSTEVTLPERADAIISDLGGALPWFERHIASIVDARRRFLAPDGVLIPRRDTAWAAVVELHDVYAERLGPWENAPFALDMEAARRIVVNTFMRARVTQENLLTDLQRWAILDYVVVEDPNVRARVSWKVMRAGAGHGLAVGFERTVADGICFSNAPDADRAMRATVYPTLWFPWPAPVALEPGDVVTIDIEARLVHRDYIWNWKTQVWAPDDALCRKANFSQSTFFGVPLSPATLQTKSAACAPTLNEDGRIARRVLESMSEGLSLEEIARRLTTEFSNRFARVRDALCHAVELSRQYGETSSTSSTGARYAGFEQTSTPILDGNSVVRRDGDENRE
jgi:protein arginine N-methyltransferase 1